MPRLKSVLFDLDGTLVDVTAATVRCVSSLAEAAGAKRIDPRVIASAQRASGTRAKLASWAVEAIGAHGGRAPSVRTVQRALADLGRHVEPDLRVVRALVHLGRSHKIAIVTNGTRDAQRGKLRAAGLSDLIEPKRVLVSGELGVRKPDARIFKRALATTGGEPEETLFVGDNEREDIAGAKAMGMRTCRVGPPGIATRADDRVSHVDELLRVLRADDPGEGAPSA